MSDTQEKLHKIFWGLYRSWQAYDDSDQKFGELVSKAEQEAQALIESAKREALEEMRPANATIESMRLYSPRKHTYMGKEYPSCSICGFCPEAMNAYIDAQLKQSEESGITDQDLVNAWNSIPPQSNEFIVSKEVADAYREQSEESE